MSCPYCYAGAKEGKELSTERWKRVLDNLVSYGVFQVTFGGGEPTLRDDLKELALHARRRGLNLCMTTNGKTLPQIGPDDLCLFNQVNVSYHGDGPLLAKALEHLAAQKILRGINFLAICRYMPQLDVVALLSDLFGAELLILSGKGVEDALPPDIAMAEAQKLRRQGFRVAVDGLTCAGELPDYCMQKRRFCDVDSLGNVMPCSFVRTPMGSLLEKRFAEIWKSRGEQMACPFVGGDQRG
jgi:MoaA/NifB/PqqE/SkfB family radical SAM enzyme